MPVSDSVASDVVDMLHGAAEASRSLTLRQGNVVVLSGEATDEAVIAGDLHGHRLNFQRLLEIADLANHPRRRLIVQEVCHGGPEYPSGGGCMSHLLLEDVARMKLAFPQSFHFLLSNHELSELTDYPILKGRRMLNLAFRQGLERLYGPAAERVRRACQEFIGSCPLAIRLPGGVFVSHSIPEQTDLAGFDVSVLERPLSRADLSDHGPVFRLTWGRDYRAANAKAFAQLVGAEVLIHGHEPCPNGCHAPNDRQVILDCCGRRACYLPLATADRWSHAQVVKRIQKLA